MKAQPWSHSKLASFKTCPRKFEAEDVSKSVPKRPPGAAQQYGIDVHKHFEDHQARGVELPPALRCHKPYMDKLRKERVGEPKVERKVALNLKLEPCGFFDKDVWWRGIIDYDAQLDHDVYCVVDYKTGKKKQEFQQLHCFLLYKFLEGANRCRAEFYWTQDMSVVPLTMERSSIKGILNGLEPDLRQYREAFRSDIWQPRPSGLCKDWCDVKDCEFWGQGGRR